jgi:hypothetical protein
MSDEIQQLKADIQRLNERLDALFRLIQEESADTTYHIKAIHDRITGASKRNRGLYDLLWPLVHKVFPGFAADAAKIEAIFERGRSDPKTR